MYRQVGGTKLDEDGQMGKGMLVRHLVLPGYLSNTLAALDTIAALFPARDVSVSLMSQYVPMGNLPAPLDRGITREEYDGALSWMGAVRPDGLLAGFFQRNDGIPAGFRGQGAALLWLMNEIVKKFRSL